MIKGLRSPETRLWRAGLRRHGKAYQAVSARRCWHGGLRLLTLLRPVLFAAFLFPTPLSLAQVSLAQAQESDLTGRPPLTLGSIDWPPYSRATLPGEGRSSVIVRDAFAAVGVPVVFDYLPWVRMTALIRAQRLDGGLSFYDSEDRQNWCHFSPPYDSSDLVLVERADNPLSWVALADLARYRLGTVRDYVNTPDFDDLVRRGILQTEEVVSDIINIRKLMSGRIDGVVIDGAVFRYLIDGEPELKARAADLRVNPVPLDRKPLYICFQKTEKGRALRDLFAEGLRQIQARPAQDARNPLRQRPNTADSSRVIR